MFIELYLVVNRGRNIELDIKIICGYGLFLIQKLINIRQ